MPPCVNVSVHGNSVETANKFRNIEDQEGMMKDEGKASDDKSESSFDIRRFLAIRRFSARDGRELHERLPESFVEGEHYADRTTGTGQLLPGHALHVD